MHTHTHNVPLFFPQGNLYVGSSFGVSKFDAVTGAQIDFFYTTQHVSQLFSVFDDLIVFATVDSTVYGIGLDMSLRWQQNYGYPLLSSVLTDGNLIFFIVGNGYTNSSLHGVNPTNGASVWSVPMISPTTTMSDFVLLGPQFDSAGQTTLVVLSQSPSSSPQLLRVFASNGTIVWNITLASIPPSYFITYTPRVVGTQAYVGVYANSTHWFWIVDLTTGNNRLEPPGFYYDPYAQSYYVAYPQEPFIVINDEIIYSAYYATITTKNTTVGANVQGQHYVFSQPDSILIYSTANSIVGYHYPSWTQRVWYDIATPTPEIDVRLSFSPPSF
jgi:outer membrane protein assembly factor BamB